ncbi:MAG: radical SAM protein [Bacteroidales bacterium]|nr:radical SAM protein [Bacteroidales bacterium]
MSFFIFEITPKCDFDCIYCYNVWKEKTDYQQNTLSLSNIVKLFDKLLSETNVTAVTISGGEPLLYPYLTEVVKILKSRGMQVGLTTHGIHLTELKIIELISAGVSYFEISLDALNSEIYHKLTNDNRLDKVKSAILNIKKHRALLTVSTIITKLNILEIPKVIDLCFAFSVDFISLNRFITGGKGKLVSEQLKPSVKELYNVLQIANQRAEKYKFNINLSVPIEDCIISHKSFPALNFGTCVCGEKKWLIDSVGNLRTCEQNTDIIGNLFTDKFTDLYHSNLSVAFRQNNFKNSCELCAEFYACGGGCRFI